MPHSRTSSDDNSGHTTTRRQPYYRVADTTAEHEPPRFNAHERRRFEAAYQRFWQRRGFEHAPGWV